jgi:hypothetical protein
MYYIHYFSVCSKISKFEAFNLATCGLSLLGGRNGPTAVEFEIKADGIESQTGFIHHPQSLLDGLLPNAQRWNGMDIFFCWTWGSYSFTIFYLSMNICPFSNNSKSSD